MTKRILFWHYRQTLRSKRTDGVKISPDSGKSNTIARSREPLLTESAAKVAKASQQKRQRFAYYKKLSRDQRRCYDSDLFRQLVDVDVSG